MRAHGRRRRTVGYSEKTRRKFRCQGVTPHPRCISKPRRARHVMISLKICLRLRRKGKKTSQLCFTKIGARNTNSIEAEPQHKHSVGAEPQHIFSVYCCGGANNYFALRSATKSARVPRHTFIRQISRIEKPAAELKAYGGLRPVLQQSKQNS